MAAANDNENSGKLPMPRFAAEGNSASAISMDAELFLSRFEDWTQVCGYQDGRKAKALGYALTKAAAIWYQQTSRREEVNTNDWNAIRTAFKLRFVKTVSPRFIATELNQLTQKPRESVADFLDRCELAQTLLDDQWKVDAAATHAQERKETLKVVHDRMVLHHFLRHIRPDIGEKLSFCPDLETLQDHVKAAERIEKAEADKGQRPAAPAIASINAPVDAINQRQGQHQQKGRKKPGPNYVCRLCGIPGHFISDCSMADKQKKRGTGKTSSPPRPQQQQQQQPQQQQQQQPRYGAVQRTPGNNWRQSQPMANFAPTEQQYVYAPQPASSAPPAEMIPQQQHYHHQQHQHQQQQVHFLAGDQPHSPGTSWPNPPQSQDFQ